jgi:ABC-type branched-subunit amino acid transport system substrate-binding protein
VALGLLAASLWGCTSSGGDGAAQTSTPEEVEGPPLRGAGFDQSRVTIGVVADLTGPDAVRQGRLVDGVEAYWADAASRGGVDGRYPVQVTVLDTAGDPEAALRLAGEHAGEVVLFGLVGAQDGVEAVRPVLVEDGVTAVVVNPLRSVYDEVTGMGAGLPLPARADALATWLAEAGEAGRWCMGDPAAAGLADALAGLAPGLGSTVAAPLPPVADGEQSLSEVATEAGCQVVWLDGSAEGRRALLDLAVSNHGGRVALVADDPELPAEVAAWAPERLVVATAAPPWDEPEPEIQAMVAAVQAHSPDLAPSDGVALGWASQQIVDRLLSDAVAAGSLAREEVALLAAALADPPSVAGSWSGVGGQRSAVGTVTVWAPGAPTEGGSVRTILARVPVAARRTPPTTG